MVVFQPFTRAILKPVVSFFVSLGVMLPCGLAMSASAWVALGVPALAWTDEKQDFAPEDPVMNAAIAQARQKLPHMFARFEEARRGTSSADDFMVKVRITADGVTEQIWMALIALDGKPVVENDAVTGIIANEPFEFTSIKLGDRFTADLNQISDWSYWQGGLLHGNYTTRVMLPKMNAQDAAELGVILAPLD